MTGAPSPHLPLGAWGGDRPGGAAEGGGVRVTTEGGVAVLNVWGCLDAEVGAAVRAAAAGAASQQARRLDIDLRQVLAFTAEGAVALRDCREAGAGLQEGLHYRTGRGPGREALLAAYTPALDWDGV
jgi:hypothetical protein